MGNINGRNWPFVAECKDSLCQANQHRVDGSNWVRTGIPITKGHYLHCKCKEWTHEFNCHLKVNAMCQNAHGSFFSSPRFHRS